MENNSINRRNFIGRTIGTAAALSIPEIVFAAFEQEKVKKIPLEKNDVILFQGDSITDAGRDRTKTAFNEGLGSGYAFLASADLLYGNPDKNLKIYNRGISGNKVYQLADRWNTDCLQLKPDVLSILIGVNDFWHTLDFNYKATIDTYRNDFKALLDRTKQALPETKLIIGEPFAIPGIKAVTARWYPAFNDYRNAAHEIAGSFNAIFIPYQNIFDKAQQSAPGVYWTYDGVHPTLAGARLMAHAWLETIKS